MRFDRTLILAVLLLTVGCNTTTKTTHQPKGDELLESFVGQSITGFWKSEKFAGEFSGFSFQKLLVNKRWATENGQYVCTLTGNGEIWGGPDSIPFTITGRSVGRNLEVTLQTSNSKITGTGALEGDNAFNARCKVIFDFHGEQHTAWLNIVDNVAIAKANFLESQKDQ